MIPFFFLCCSNKSSLPQFILIYHQLTCVEHFSSFISITIHAFSIKRKEEEGKNKAESRVEEELIRCVVGLQVDF